MMDALHQKAAEMFVKALQDGDVDLHYPPEKVATQIHTLELLAKTLHEISSVQGGIGYRFFHHADSAAMSVDCAIGNLRLISELSRVLGEFHDTIS